MKTKYQIKPKPRHWKDTLFAFICLIPSIITVVSISTVLIAYGYSPWITLPVSLILTGLFVGFGYAVSGSDLMDFIVSSIIIMILAIILVPVFIKAKQNQQRKQEKIELRKKHLQPAPQSQWG
jgi:ABC-type uncharacterized transport system permease subunit